ncbi:MAG: hypothetical protein J6X49_08785 [Victivallales bacterium]|nr:hypothetical protein [Victivallales bacterium]
MSQQLEPIYNTDEIRMRRMLAYKSLILSILKKSIIFLVLIAILVTAGVLYFFYKQNLKLPYRHKATTSLVYDPKHTTGVSSISLGIVSQVISSRQLKDEAAKLVNLPQHEQSKINGAIEITIPRGTPNLLVITAGADKPEEAIDLVNMYARLAVKAYSQYRVENLRGKINELNKQKTVKTSDLQSIEAELQKLVESMTASTPAQELERLKQLTYRQQDEISQIIKQTANEKLRHERLVKSMEGVNQDAIKNYKRIIGLITERDKYAAILEAKKQLYTEIMPQVIQARSDYEYAQKNLDKVLEELKINETDVLFIGDAFTSNAELENSETLLAILAQHQLVAEQELEKTQTRISEIRELLPRQSELMQKRDECKASLAKLEDDINTNSFLISLANQELKILETADNAFFSGGLDTKKFVLSTFIGCLCSFFCAILLISIFSRFGSINSATELQDLAEIEVFDMSVSKLKNFDEAHLKEFTSNIYYELSQIMPDRALLFYGALRGSYSTSLLFDQMLFQFAINGVRVFVLNLEPYNMTVNPQNPSATSDANAEDEVAAELLGVEKQGNFGLFKLGNANFLSPNENDILRMDFETLLNHYDKIFICRQAQFSGKELLFKQLTTMTKSCLLSVGKNKSPRSFLKLIRDSHADEDTIITGIFTEP